MVDIVLWLVLGAFIGWHIPEPVWAKAVKAKVLNMFKKQ